LPKFLTPGNEVKECGLKKVNKIRASNFLAEGARISSYASACTRIFLRVHILALERYW